MFKHWYFDDEDKQYVGTTAVADVLPSGMYTLSKSYTGRPVATRAELRTDRVKHFVNGPFPAVHAEIDRFWSSGARYQSLGVSHKRSFLLHGPSGCGKTGIVSSIIEDTIRRNGLVFSVNNINEFIDGITPARQVEKNRPIVVILEDVDEIIRKDEEDVLEMLDGASSLGDGMLFLLTTNYIDRIPERIRCRPSRVDTLVEVGIPSREHRAEYLSFLLGHSDVENLVQATDNFTLAMLKELVLSIRVYGRAVEESVAVIRGMADVDG